MEELLLDQEQSATQLNKASLGVRFGTYIIDALFLFVIQTVIEVIGVVMSDNPFEEPTTVNVFTGQLISLLIFTVYYVVMEGTTGKTIGKYLLKTRVVSKDGKKPTMSQIIGRSFARIVPFEPFSFFGSEPTGWHDRWSKTLVIKE
ncbi:RDD family protein [Lishizhenia sp.]|uniref:RDD family protein n=1 Tax=Lishizhenia sp. TaxID=2497594 RepID=UPI00299F1305|nr:RDD family protein [Lishizhenia sp.]MDX1446374.1 RDD family protein [Lishizhenia sp.]